MSTTQYLDYGSVVCLRTIAFVATDGVGLTVTNGCDACTLAGLAGGLKRQVVWKELCEWRK